MPRRDFNKVAQQAAENAYIKLLHYIFVTVVLPILIYFVIGIKDTMQDVDTSLNKLHVTVSRLNAQVQENTAARRKGTSLQQVEISKEN